MSQTPVWHVCGTRPRGIRQESCIRTPKKTADQQEVKRADDGNRTRMTSLEGSGCSDVQLRFRRLAACLLARECPWITLVHRPVGHITGTPSGLLACASIDLVDGRSAECHE
jgi:hypothetical protein